MSIYVYLIPMATTNQTQTQSNSRKCPAPAPFKKAQLLEAVIMNFFNQDAAPVRAFLNRFYRLASLLSKMV